MATIRKLSDNDVRAIFESLHGSAPPPTHLQFKIYRCGPHTQTKSPPSYEFEEGLYVLLAPEKKNKPIPKIPPHLAHLEVREKPEELCPWSLSGPQFPVPTAIQQRYCYPNGTKEYSNTKGGSLWTMYGPHGSENLDFRLLHVYYSDKRAANKGVSQEEIAAEKSKRQHDDSSITTGSVGSGSTITKKRRKASYIADQRAIRSSWQQPSRYYRREMPVHQPHYYPPHYPVNYRPPPGRGYSVGYDFPNALPMPPSPDRQDRKHNARPMGALSYVSPAGESTASQQDVHRAFSNNAKMFDTHPLASFDAGDVDATVTALSTEGSSVFRSTVFRPQKSLESAYGSSPGNGHTRDDSQAQIAHLLDETNFESSLMDLEQAWKSDPELQMNMTFSRDEEDRARFVPPANVYADQFVLRLERLHEKIRQGIFSHPPEDRPALVSIVAEWARCVARSPLEPFPQCERGQAPYHQVEVSTINHGPPIKTEQEGSGNTAAV